ncbi:DMT family transporter [Pseudidiomarina terrestris]|uniref:DMT family transporter n=1 Tax=Pseudidiomarina terrestris TaxID=2820060 RepID=A0AAW7QYC2_9GAMM|nr:MULTISPECIES: DMT family transporter [unclassified Pseudidiomarina]MDN7129947.1 DMT family transporter [Pseudidiomarina sp. 1APR75-15]MDN7138362.1 DMT family transporter [Pseudidiomarina sp. 1ASP75-14]MDN7125186.1 DMT family transporter [Pseudidiomarina sp. 1APP75-32.1]MDN7127411.1 DMT family transporter [Pseudidiomarina sp. 1APR75-33.1]MDN7136113.1 DMT family transporter [Pseudidiomarina sp. 1ASP75-5]
MPFGLYAPLRLVSPGKWVRRSTLLVTLAAFCWGLSGGIGAILMERGWDAFTVSFYRGAVGFLFVVIWLALRPQRSGLSKPKLWLWSVVAGVGVAGNFAFYFLSIAEGSVAVAATLMYCAPVFVYLVSFVLGLESPSLFKCLAILLVMSGVVLLTQIYTLSAGAVTLFAVTTGLLSGLSYAMFIFGFKYAAPHGSAQAILVIAFAVLAGILIVLGEVDQVSAAWSSASFPLLVLLGVLGAGLSFVFYIFGLNYTAPAIASMVAMVEPITASLFGVVVLGENLNVIQILGMALILVTVTALSVHSSRRKASIKDA